MLPQTLSCQVHRRELVREMGYGVEHNLLVWVSSNCLYKVDLLTNKHFAEKHRLKKPFEPLSEKLSKKQRTLPNKLFTSLLLIYLCFSKACMKPTHTLGVRGGQQTKFSFFDFTRFFRISWTLYYYYYCYYYFFFFFRAFARRPDFGENCFHTATDF